MSNAETKSQKIDTKILAITKEYASHDPGFTWVEYYARIGNELKSRKKVTRVNNK